MKLRESTDILFCWDLGQRKCWRRLINIVFLIIGVWLRITFDL